MYEVLFNLVADLISASFFVLVAVGLYQPNAPRLFATLTFLGVALSHEAMFSHLDDLGYYASAALFDLIIIIITSGIKPMPKMVISLHKVCLVFVAVNALGWAASYNGIKAIYYNAACLGLFVWIIAIFLKRDSSDVGNFTLDSWRTCFHFNIRYWQKLLQKGAGKT